MVPRPKYGVNTLPSPAPSPKSRIIPPYFPASHSRRRSGWQRASLRWAMTLRRLPMQMVLV